MSKINQIFKEIDDAIEKNLTNKPVPFIESKFYKEYLEIKKKWLK